MERKKEMEIRGRWMMKSLLAAYVTSCVMLLGISFLLYKFDLSEQAVEIGIMITYVLSAFVGGFFAGKEQKIRRFLWGALIGVLYFVFLVLISIGVYRSSFVGTDLVMAFGMCLAGGMAGGMLS